MDAMQYVSQLVEKSHIAQKQFETYTQQQVDEAVRLIGKAVYDNAEVLAREAVEETGMGNYEDKVHKHKGKSKTIWNYLKGKKSVGILRYIEEEGLVEVAKPIGVIGVVTPTTNPTTTAMHNAMIALKGRNSIIISPHPRAKKCCKHVVDIMNEALSSIGAPENLIQIIEEPTLETAKLTMELPDACVSTGGAGRVKVAYSSGKPAYGVGPGNVQCLIDSDVDFNEAAKLIIAGRAYDNGILCTCEQSVICPKEKYDKVIDAFEKNGAHYVSNPNEVSAVKKILFPDGKLSKDCVGKTAKQIAQIAGITVDSKTKVLIIKATGVGKEELLGKEKMCPVLAAYTYQTWDEAIAIANANLDMEGKGHSTVIHSNTKENIEQAAQNISVSRFAINQTGSSALGGSFFNGLVPTSTLGCGSWGNNSISENLSYKHLINISRIAYVIPGKTAPTDEEIWKA